jgi:cytochrome c peroxidase
MTSDSDFGRVLLVGAVVLGSGCASMDAATDVAMTGEHLFENEKFGGNGRTCRTCHSSENGTLTSTQVEALFESDPGAPLFRSIDSDDGQGNSYTRLRRNATIRVTLPVPPNIRIKEDPTATTFTMNRGIPTTMDISLTDQVLMADGRDADLPAQARGAIAAHYQAPTLPPLVEMEALAEFESTVGFFSSKATELFARGGSAPELPLGTTPAEGRGRRFFVAGGQCTVCHSGPMLDTTDANNGAFGAGSRVEGNLVSVNAELLGLAGGNFATGANVARTWVFAGGGENGADLEIVSPDLESHWSPAIPLTSCSSKSRRSATSVKRRPTFTMGRPRRCTRS